MMTIHDVKAILNISKITCLVKSNGMSHKVLMNLKTNVIVHSSFEDFENSLQVGNNSIKPCGITRGNNAIVNKNPKEYGHTNVMAYQQGLALLGINS